MGIKGEKAICKEFGLIKTPASGALWKHKSDALDNDCRYEIKETDGTGIRVTELMLSKIKKEAHITNKSPRMILRIKDEFWVMLPAREYFDD